MNSKYKLKKKPQFIDPSFIPDDQFDFHGLGPLTPYDIEMHLLKFIENSYNANYDQVLIITGKGHRVRPQVQRLLGKSPYIKNFKSAGYYNGQDGAFEVYLG